MSTLGLGCYTAAEAARLIRMPSRTIQRWLRGYSYEIEGRTGRMPSLWEPELPAAEGDPLELGFRDLIELRFVHAFTRQGLDLRIIRSCIEHARRCLDDDRPFSTRRFKTDGRTIFLESLRATGEQELLDLRRGQFVIKEVIEQTFKDLDIDDVVVARWRPLQGKDSIVIDPKRAFGQPITAQSGVPTIALADAARAEGTAERVSMLYDVPLAVVRGAVRFEERLHAA